MGEKTGNTRIRKGRTELEWMQKDGPEWRDEKTGQVTELSDAFKERTQLTSERGRELRYEQIEAFRKEAHEGMMRAVDEGRMVNTRSSPEAWGYLTQRQAEIADSLDQGMASVKAYQNVERAIGLEQQGGGQAQAQKIEVNINISEKATEGFDADVEFLEAEFKDA